VRAELGFGEQDIVVGCVAVLREPKGHADLLQAMVPLCKTIPNLHLVVVGDGQPVMGRLQALRANTGCSARCICSATAMRRTPADGRFRHLRAGLAQGSGRYRVPGSGLCGVPIVATALEACRRWWSMAAMRSSPGWATMQP
jgi:glycosyltransferase involved in cell wall biosynthesis